MSPSAAATGPPLRDGVGDFVVSLLFHGRGRRLWMRMLFPWVCCRIREAVLAFAAGKWIYDDSAVHRRRIEERTDEGADERARLLPSHISSFEEKKIVSTLQTAFVFLCM